MERERERALFSKAICRWAPSRRTEDRSDNRLRTLSIRATQFRSYQLNYRHSTTLTDRERDLKVLLSCWKIRKTQFNTVQSNTMYNIVIDSESADKHQFHNLLYNQKCEDSWWLDSKTSFWCLHSIVSYYLCIVLCITAHKFIICILGYLDDFAKMCRKARFLTVLQ